MRRRELLGSLAGGAVVAMGGCLGGNVVMEKQESVRIEPHTGWIQEIDEASGSGSVSYTIRSEDDRFQVLYFVDDTSFEYYQDHTFGNGEEDQAAGNGGQGGAEVPTGHDELSRIALQNEQRDVYEAVMPSGDGRYSIDFDSTHHLVVDYSDYGQGLQVADTAEAIHVTVGLEVVEDHF